MATQQSIISRRKIRPNYTDIINAQTPYLAGLKSTLEEKKYRDKELELQEENMEQQEEEAKKAAVLGAANLGVQGYVGYRQNKILSEALPKRATVATSNINAPVNIGQGFKGAFTSIPTYAGAGAGVIAASPFKTDREQITAGALAGGLTSWASGGDIYSMIASSVIGGSLGGLW